MQMNKVTVKPLGLGQNTSSKVYLLFGDTHKKLYECHTKPVLFERNLQLQNMISS